MEEISQARWDLGHPSEHTPPKHFYWKTGEPHFLFAQKLFLSSFWSRFLIGAAQGVLRHKSLSSTKSRWEDGQRAALEGSTISSVSWRGSGVLSWPREAGVAGLSTETQGGNRSLKLSFSAKKDDFSSGLSSFPLSSILDKISISGKIYWVHRHKEWLVVLSSERMRLRGFSKTHLSNPWSISENLIHKQAKSSTQDPNKPLK